MGAEPSGTDGAEKRPWTGPILTAAALFVLALVVRSYWLSPHATLTGDEEGYHGLAVRLVHGQGFTLADGSPTAWRTPGFPVVLATIYRCLGVEPAAARMVLAGLSALTAPALYFLGRRLFPGSAIGLVAGSLWACSPTSRWFAGALMGESTAALLVVGALLGVVVAAERKSAVWAAGSGMLLGAAVLTRGFLLPVLFVPALWLLPRGRRLAAAALVGGLCLPLAWTARNAARVGMVTLSTQTPQIIWYGNNRWARGSWPFSTWAEQEVELRSRHPSFDALSEKEQAAVYSQEALREFTEHPRRIAWLLPRKAAIFFSPVSYLGVDWLFAVLIPLVGLGLWCLLQRSRLLGKALLLGGPVLGVLLITLIVFGDPRFRHPVDPCLMLLAAYGIHRLWRRRSGLEHSCAR